MSTDTKITWALVVMVLACLVLGFLLVTEARAQEVPADLDTEVTLEADYGGTILCETPTEDTLGNPIPSEGTISFSTDADGNVTDVETVSNELVACFARIQDTEGYDEVFSIGGSPDPGEQLPIDLDGRASSVGGVVTVDCWCENVMGGRLAARAILPFRVGTPGRPTLLGE